MDKEGQLLPNRSRKPTAPSVSSAPTPIPAPGSPRANSGPPPVINPPVATPVATPAPRSRKPIQPHRGLWESFMGGFKSPISGDWDKWNQMQMDATEWLSNNPGKTYRDYWKFRNDNRKHDPRGRSWFHRAMLNSEINKKS